MNKRKIIALVILVVAIIAAAILYFSDGGTVNAGTWSETPIEHLNEYAGAGVTYTEIETVSLGENGAVMFYTEKKDTEAEAVFNIGFFKVKNEADVKLYTHYSSYTITKDAFSANNILLEDMSEGSYFYGFVAVSQLSREEIISRYPIAENAIISTISFELDGTEYSLNYIIKALNSDEEAQSYADSIEKPLEHIE